MSILTNAVDQILEGLSLLPGRMTSGEAITMLLAIGLQESRLTHRFQIVAGKPGAKGPARGWWQFEKGGVRGVLRHKASQYWAHGICRARGVEPETETVWAALEHDQVLAAGIARLLLFTDPRRLPAVGDADAAWDLYIRCWRPGKPHPHTWPELYGNAVAITRSLEGL